MCKCDLPKIIVIAGTNASGKSALGIELAKKYSGEIISADSRQIYKGFDLCCGKVTKEEQAAVPHHLLDICEIGDSYSVTDYQKKVYSLVPQIIAQGHIPFIVGGTGLYISSVVNGYEFKDENLDLDFRKELETKSLEDLQKMLPPKAISYLNGNVSDMNNTLLIIGTSVQTPVGIFLQAIGKGGKSSVLSLSKQAIFPVAGMLLLCPLIGVTGVLAARSISDGLAFILSLILLVTELRSFGKKNQELQNQETV